MIRSSVRTATACAVLALALAGCGAGAAAGPAPSSPDSTATESAATESAATESAATPSPSSAKTTTPTDAASDAPTDAPDATGPGATADPSLGTALTVADSATCGDAQAAWADANKALVGMSGSNPGSLVLGFSAARDALRSIEPPAQIADDWRTVSAYMSTVAKALEDVDRDDKDALDAALAGIDGDLDTVATTTASTEVTGFLDGDCVAPKVP